MMFTRGFGRLFCLTLVVFVKKGMASALQCIDCNWNAKNSTVDDNCLAAPFKSKTVECAAGNSPGERIVCQTLAVFNKESGVNSLERLERKCGSKHSRCNNACSDDVPKCWLCCVDNDKCNGFPLRSNIVVTTTSSATGLQYIYNAIVLVTFCVFLNLV